MAEYKLSYESQLDAFHPSHQYDTRKAAEDWKTAALRGPALPALGNAVAGAAGSAISNVVIYPLNVIVARLQTQKQRQSGDSPEYTSLLDAARKIYQRQGVAGFYPGLAQDTYKTVVDSFLFFLAYTTARQRRIAARYGAARAAKNKHIVLPIMDELAIGILAGAFTKLFTTPLANIVTRKQTSASRQDGKKDLSTSEIAAQIRSEKGLLGFWSGYSASLILTLNPSITLFLNEVLKYTLLPRAKRDRPPPAVIFFLAAISKAAASSVTYPFSLAKTRAQVMGQNSQDSTEKSSRAADIATDPDSLLAALTPQIVSTVLTIARTEGISAVYAGLEAEVMKGFFSHGFTMLAKDAVYASIVKLYYLLLIVLRRYPSSDELLHLAREQAEEYTEVAREGARDLAERTDEALNGHSGAVSVDMTSSSGDFNETAELVGDYVEDETAEWKSFYHWFWETDRTRKG